jgi:hypothetical protein
MISRKHKRDETQPVQLTILRVKSIACPYPGNTNFIDQFPMQHFALNNAAFVFFPR